MGLLKNLRDRRNQQTRVERNTETLRREFSRELTKEDLSDMIRLMDEPEVHKPLFENAEAFGRQPEMDDILRARFQLKALDILGRDSKELESVMNMFNEGSDTYEADKDTRRLSDKLLLDEQDEYVSVKDRIANRIQTTRQDINDRVEYQQEKVKNKIRSIDRSIERRVRPLVDVAQDSVKGMLQGVKDRVQSFKDDYRTRQITIENAQNWEIALEKGVSAEQIESVIEHADYPEVRYGVMKHASALFEQDAMTPELATELFYAYQPHTNAQNEMHERFYKQLETYANTVVEQVETNELSISPEEYAQQVEARKPVSPEEYAQSVEARNKTVSPEEYAQSVEARNKTVSPEEYAQSVETPKEPVREVIEETPLEGEASENRLLSEYGADDAVAFENSTTLSRLMHRNGIDTLPDLQRMDDGLDIRQAQLLGISEQGDAVWGVPDNGEIRHLSDDEVEAAFMEQYEASKNRFVSEYGANRFLSEYGADDAVAFENSHTLSRLMSRNGIDTLPDLPRTDDGLDVRQAQLLGISTQGDAVWGVPDNGEIRHLSDDELEGAFMEQYGKTIDSHDIPLPDASDAPAEDESYNFYESLAREFNQQWNDESELMASSAPLPDEHDAPPLHDEDDAPPLSFEGLDVQQLQEM